MSKTLSLFLIICILILGGYFVFSHRNQETSQTPTVNNEPSILGCYRATLAQDVYTLIIQSREGDNIAGTLAYNNYQKDSSHGSLVGTYKDGILLGEYSFDSEGMHSIRQVIFKKVDDTFIQGFGPVEVVDNREAFKDVNDITYSSSSTFKASPCQ